MTDTDRSQIQLDDQKSKKKRSWRRRALWLLFIIPLLLVATVLVIGQTSVMQFIVEPILEDQLGVGVSTGSIKLMPTGEVVIIDATCQSSTIDHRGGSLIEFERATIEVNWWGVIRGTDQVRSIFIEKPIVRVSQDIESGVLNLAEIAFKKGSGGGSTPAMEVRNGILQIAEHNATDYRVLRELSINGRLTEQTSSGVSGFEFVALPIESSLSSSSSRRGSIGLTGQLSSDGVDGVLDGVRLEDWPAEIVPSRSRDIYQRLALSGELAPTRFHISNDGLIEIVLTLDGVAISLPIDESPSALSTIGEADPLRMRQTRGVIRFGTLGLKADIHGVIDELEYDVVLDYKGLDTTSPFEASLVTDFRLDSQFKPAKFLPENVIAKLERFERPEADVHAEVFVARSDDPNDRSVKVSGVAQLANGKAIYKKFKYPFHDLNGTIEFDPDKLVVREITGVGPDGATLVANGLFSPLGENSVVTLDLKVEGVGIDDHLMRALNDDQKELIGALFNDKAHGHLLDEGLVLSQSDADELGNLRRQTWDRLNTWVDGVDGSSQEKIAFAKSLSEIDRQLEAPVFDFGGSANIDVQLVRHPERPSDDRWTTDVLVKLPNAGLVPGHFPLPIRARDIEIVITEKSVKLKGGKYTGLKGGWASVEVNMDMTKSNSKPLIDIFAHDFPIDARLIAAIPGYHAQQSEDPDDVSLRRILDRLRLGGVMECEAHIGPRSDGHLGYDVESTILSGTARPMKLINSGIESDSNFQTGTLGGDPLALDQLYGTIFVTEEMIVVNLDGLLSSPEQPLAPTPIDVLTQLTLPTKRRGIGGIRRVKGLLPTDEGPPLPGPQLFATAYADGIDLAMPLEHAIAVISPKLARDLLQKKQSMNPDGILGVSAQLEGVVGGTIDSIFTIDRIDQLGLDFNGSRYTVGSSWGRSKFELTQKPRVEFDGVRVSIKSDGDDAGTLSLDGALPLARPGRQIEITESESLKVEYLNGLFDSPITLGVVDQLTNSDDDESWIKEHKLGGRFDLDVVLSPKLGVHQSPATNQSFSLVPTLVEGSLQPKTISLQMGDESAQFDDVSGAVLFNGFEGIIKNIQATDGTTNLGVDGQWSLDSKTGLAVDLSINAKGDLLGGPVRAIMPNTIDRVIDRLSIKSAGPVEINDLQIHASAIGSDEQQFRINGSADLIEGSALIGLPITGIAGELGFRVQGDGKQVGYEVRLDASRLRAGLMRIHDAEVLIIGDADNPGVVLVPEIRAGMHGGQIAGSAQIRPGIDGVPHYWMEMHASGVRASPVFDDFLLPPEGLVGPPRPGFMSVLSSWSLSDDLSKGAMISDLTMTGPVDDPSKRSGRGLAQISGGSIVALPGLINLLEVSNLSLPAGSPLDLAEASFYIDGETLAFERLSASSKRIEILGYGTMDWLSRDVDLRFRSRSVNPIPIVSELLEELRDELITARVTGQMGNLKYSAEQFGSTMRLINAMLGAPISDQKRRLREVEEQVEANRASLVRKERDRVHLPNSESPRVDSKSWDWVEAYENSTEKRD